MKTNLDRYNFFQSELKITANASHYAIFELYTAQSIVSKMQPV